eukprot:s5885_g1.t1
MELAKWTLQKPQNSATVRVKRPRSKDPTAREGFKNHLRHLLRGQHALLRDAEGHRRLALLLVDHAGALERGMGDAVEQRPADAGMDAIDPDLAWLEADRILVFTANSTLVCTHSSGSQTIQGPSVGFSGAPTVSSQETLPKLGL